MLVDDALPQYIAELLPAHVSGQALRWKAALLMSMATAPV